MHAYVHSGYAGLHNTRTVLPPHPWRRWGAASIFLVCLLYLRSALHSKPTRVTPAPPVDIVYLRNLVKDNGLGPDVELAGRHLIPDFSADERLLLTNIPTELFSNPPLRINLETATSLPYLSPPLFVPVEKSRWPEEVDASALIFGVSTTFSRFNDDDVRPLREWARWLTDGSGKSNGATLVLCLHKVSEEQLDMARNKLADAGINATVQGSDSALDMGGRWFALVSALYNHPTRDSRQYFGLIDDDTFFPSIGALISSLSKYHPSKPYYIGAFTERDDKMLHQRRPMAYGGAGVFLTSPTAKQLTDLTPTCLTKDPKSGLYLERARAGDVLLYHCLHKHTETGFSHLPELRQMDIDGDPSGFYESGQLPLSIHHYRSSHLLAPEKLHAVADACGPSCVLQRFKFANNWILSNGYSLSEYPQGIDFDIMQMEHTFRINAVNLTYSFGPLRKNLTETGRKISWTLLDAKNDGGGKITQVYVKRKDDERWLAQDKVKPQLDSIIVLTWG